MEESKKKALEYITGDFDTLTRALRIFDSRAAADPEFAPKIGGCNFVCLMLCVELLRLFPQTSKPSLAALMVEHDPRYEGIMRLISPYNADAVGVSLYEFWEQNAEFAIGGPLSKAETARHLTIEDGRQVIMPTVMYTAMLILIAEHLENV